MTLKAFLSIQAGYFSRHAGAAFYFSTRSQDFFLQPYDSAITWCYCYFLCHHQLLQDLKPSLVRQIAFQLTLGKPLVKILTEEK